MKKIECELIPIIRQIMRSKLLVAMKATIFILLISITQVFAVSTYSQNTRLNLSLKNTSIREVIKEIEQQSEFYFIYDATVVNVEKQVNVEFKDKLITDVLDEILVASNIEYKIKDRQIALTEKKEVNDIQQEKTITGKVTDSSGEPLPGVTVVVKGTTQGTITDFEGNYSISGLSGDAILQFSFVGMITQEISTDGKTNIDIVMVVDAIGLEEVVAIGYGTQKKATLTGSVVSTSGEDIIQSRTPNVINSLTGRVPGVIINNRTGLPGNENVSIFIRGRGTTGDASPLIIIDGVERESLETINPNDIESVNVLKDASAAIYGARAANGVILVTTKRGQQGAPTINLTYNQGFYQFTRIRNMADSYTFATVYNEIEYAAGRPAFYSDEELQKFKDGTDPNYANTDWFHEVTKPLTPQHRINLTAQGGTDRISYYFSLGEENQKGNFEYDKYSSSINARNINLRSNVDVQVTKYLKVGLDLAGRYVDNHYPSYGDTNLGLAMLYLPTWTFYWPGTRYIRPLRDSENLLNFIDDTAGTDDRNLKGLESTFSFKLDIPWIKGLYVDGTANYDITTNFRKVFTKPSYVYYYDSTTDTYTQGLGGASIALARLSESYNQSTALTVNAKINYNRSFDSHNLGIMVGWEQRETKFDTFQASRSNYLSTALPQLFAGSSDKQYQSNDGSGSESARLNYFGRVTYDYAGKYLAQLILRYDGSQNFPKDKRFGFFPGISLGWRLSEEQFMKNLDFVDNIKIRASYGEMGNDRVASFQYLTSYGFGSSIYVIGGGDKSTLNQTGVPNPNITWEVAKTYNVGTDVTLWKGLFSANLDLFKARRSNILTKRTAVVPDYTGLQLPDENIGIVDNKGFELVLSHMNSINNDLSYSISGNVSFARNKVIFADEAPAAEPYQLATGRPMNSQLLYKAIGIFADQAEIDSYPHFAGARPGDVKYEDVNNDEIINSLDRIRINENAVPEIVYGFDFGLDYKGFDLSVLLQGQENAQVQFQNLFAAMSTSLGNFNAFRAEDRWTPDNIDATMPRASVEVFNNNTLESTQWLFDAGFLRLKNLEVGYNLPPSVCEKLKIDKLRVYVGGYNLGILYDHMSKSGYDPESTSWSYYAPQRTYNLGLNLTF
ncbi:TonB-dependent receptor [uncultured Draconibacterium sp.]|uniref:TonB-dependent receptor n=1 Tax=uncultured Draconibacterium sp. TaxID=1573823 RepID=UPI003217A1B7